jgi:hypothetical protein
MCNHTTRPLHRAGFFAVLRYMTTSSTFIHINVAGYSYPLLFQAFESSLTLSAPTPCSALSDDVCFPGFQLHGANGDGYSPQTRYAAASDSGMPPARMRAVIPRPLHLSLYSSPPPTVQNHSCMIATKT